MNTEIISLSQIQVNGANPRIIRDDKFEKLVTSILVLPKMLELRPIVVDNSMVALGGNMRFRALTAIQDMDVNEIAERLANSRDFQKKTEAEKQHLLDYWSKWQDSPTAPIINANDLSDEEQRQFIIKDNVGFGEWDMDALANEWDNDDLLSWGIDVWNESNTGDNAVGSTPNGAPANTSLNDRFIVPPFSILDTRRGYWQSRKKMWRDKIGDMGESREDKLIKAPEFKYKDIYQKTHEHRKQLGISFREYLDKYVSEEEKNRAGKVLASGVSLFDPVLSEVMVKWFTPYNGSKIFDPFAGDTQKGLVFAYCGHSFTGVELRQEQVDINNRIIADRGLDIKYICDDGLNVANHFEPESQDLLFSCPPYFNLEIYSDMENDASNQGTYGDFISIIENAFKSAIGCLKNNRFAVVVVGDIRDKKTCGYYGFQDDIKRIFKEAGCLLYNEIILIETGASTALRASRYMDSRKVGKMHQNVLVFYKGDADAIKQNFPRIEYTDEDETVFTETTTENGVDYDPREIFEEEGESTEEDAIDLELKELLSFRKPYIKQELIGYEHYRYIKNAISNGEINIVRNPITNAIVGYLWLQDLKTKPISRIYEICSAQKGLGRELVEYAIKHKKNETLQLYVLDYNQNAIDFYKHIGFVEVERETGQKKNNITMEYRGNADA